MDGSVEGCVRMDGQPVGRDETQTGAYGESWTERQTQESWMCVCGGGRVVDGERERQIDRAREEMETGSWSPAPPCPGLGVDSPP